MMRPEDDGCLALWRPAVQKQVNGSFVHHQDKVANRLATPGRAGFRESRSFPLWEEATISESRTPITCSTILTIYDVAKQSAHGFVAHGVAGHIGSPATARWQFYSGISIWKPHEQRRTRVAR